jgi:hypothetical protein
LAIYMINGNLGHMFGWKNKGIIVPLSRNHL